MIAREGCRDLAPGNAMRQRDVRGHKQASQRERRHLGPPGEAIERREPSDVRERRREPPQ